MLKAALALSASLMLCLTLSAQSGPASSPPARTGASGKGTTKPTAPSRAEWSESIESFCGITREQFNQAGLAKLTKDEFGPLMLAIYDIRREAVENTKKRQVTYVCGPLPVNYDKVKLYVDVNDKTPAEIASGVRQRLRGLADVEIVYTPIEADIGLEILGFEDELENGRKTGYSVSVASYDPCKGSLGDNSGPSVCLTTTSFLQRLMSPKLSTTLSHT
jgi:hypothetical protein